MTPPAHHGTAPDRRRWATLVATLAAALMGGCADAGDRLRALRAGGPTVAPGEAQHVAGGDAERGRALLARHACTTCHSVPGVRGPSAAVGPPLAGFAQRTNIAGHLPNQPEALVRFIANAPREVPGTAMPDLGLSDAEARDLAAWLYTLR